jgi:hypothetical protein
LPTAFAARTVVRMADLASILEKLPELGRLLQQLASPQDPACRIALELQLEQRIMVEDAAAIHKVHATTFKRHYSHLIEKFGPRCQRIKLRDALNPQPPPTRSR